MLLHGTPDQKRKLIRECLTGESESSSDDEFQKEMEAELNTTMRTMEGKWKLPEMGKSHLASVCVCHCELSVVQLRCEVNVLLLVLEVCGDSPVPFEAYRKP